MQHLLIYILLIIKSWSAHLTHAYTTGDIVAAELINQYDFFKSGPYGSTTEGEWFTDFWQSSDGLQFIPKNWPDGINIRYGARIDGIQLFYGNYIGKMHGGEGGRSIRIKLYKGDRIVKVKGKHFGPYGDEKSGRSFEATPGRTDCALAWIYGRARFRLDGVTFVWKCPKKGGDLQSLNTEFLGYDGSRQSLNSGGRSYYNLLLIYVLIYTCFL
ncbi:unnamed protein product [Lepeophtheirus salmonis]|uniref:(salmon louse) hypothetical protein n=1 Tax=Lepeophtheirus salmonis TaxID=72036 RepID=A0A7R8H808_LEPSM|nr:unnamed protein product [Lepeophtheirus salmonis]CAF2913946.1 unnamed protein product [Lepeophtheirus salmonis]